MGKYFEKMAISQRYAGNIIGGARKKLQVMWDHANRLALDAGISPPKHVQAEVDSVTDLVASTSAKIDTTVYRVSERFARRIDPAIKIHKVNPASEKALAVFYGQRASGGRPRVNV